MKRLLSKFIGGVHVPPNKEVSTQCPVEMAAIPKQLVLPLHQHIGNEAQPIVNVGERVLKGQKIARAVDYVSAPIHAPTSGIVTAIEMRPVAHPSGLSAKCIVIDTDGKDEWCSLSTHAHDYRQMDASELRNIIREAGIVGLGGAGFPSYIKLNPGPDRIVETLVINGSECEPYITCDDMLMRDRAEEIVGGTLIARHALQAKECLIAVESNKPEALAAFRAVLNKLDDSDIELVEVPTIYPAGGEKQLIHTVTGKHVPSDGLPIHIGVVCQNVGTVAAIYRAVNHGEPLISRYVTVTGDVARPCNLEVMLGTPMNELVAQAGGYTGELKRLIVGGPMMGFAMHSELVPVIKTSNCVLSDCGSLMQQARSSFAMPCIRCGSCADVCPVKLLPQQLYWYAKGDEFERLQEFFLFDCIECGCCDYVCPANIPLVQYYRYAKAEIWKREREKRKSDTARERHEFRQFRLEREKEERSAKHKQRMNALKDNPQTESGGKEEAEDPKKAAILAAMERVKAKKEAQDSTAKNTENLTPQQQQKIDEIDARRAAIREQDQAKDQDGADSEN